ncbi:Alpha/Beta hydrolase protein [Chiua virens]|nr:Alpha/Beta hydrolase protein [Chiua virens]
MPLTDAQQNAMPQVRAAFDIFLHPPGLGTRVDSLDERARRPGPETVPEDVTVKVEIAPPSQNPHPLLNKVLKTPEPTPIFFYALHSDKTADVKDTRVIFHIHCGGNVVGHPTEASFIQFYAQLLRAAAEHSGDASKCVLVAPCYRLATAPQNAFPAALQDLVAAYDYVLGKGYNPSNIVISGDSAGGNHTIVLTHLIRQSGGTPPRGIISIAPMAMQALDDLSEQAKANASGFDILNVPLCKTFASSYVGDSGVALTDPLVSGVYLPFTESWPKTLILAVNAPVELVVYDDLPHAWWIMPELFLEQVQDAAKRVAQFVLE